MKTKILILLFAVSSQLSYSQCFPPTSLFADNINYYNGTVNWTETSEVDFFRIRYKEINAPSWSFVNNVDSALSSKLLVGLTPLSDYIWQIKSYCDSLSSSSWSVTDSFTTNTTNCPTTNNLFATNINYNNAIANWDTVSGGNRYKLRYKAIGTSTWAELGPIYHPSNSMVIPMLQQNTSYEWQVLTYHDSTTLLASLWSQSDTFTTTLFVPAPFNPIITNTLSSLECNVQAELYVRMTQSTNEPDIGTGTITSDGGSFNISSINSGDSVGYATMNTAFQNITTVLEAGIVLGQNYAIINSYDSTGALVGFFTIENDNGGIKVEILGSPNDGNNYTIGYVSEIYFTNIFVTPENAGPLHFFADISSELNDQINISDTSIIWCNTTGLAEEKISRKVINIYDAVGKKSKLKKNTIQFLQYSNGRVTKTYRID